MSLERISFIDEETTDGGLRVIIEGGSQDNWHPAKHEVDTAVYQIPAETARIILGKLVSQARATDGITVLRTVDRRVRYVENAYVLDLQGTLNPNGTLKPIERPSHGIFVEPNLTVCIDYDTDRRIPVPTTLLVEDGRVFHDNAQLRRTDEFQHRLRSFLSDTQREGGFDPIYCLEPDVIAEDVES